MNRLQAALILLVLWAAIYLPGLGSTELKGEEGRRILPAMTMIETGNWVVPFIGGKPFLRKPPLINWAIAGSFQLTGIRNEWTARLPSALAVLALGLTIIGLASGGRSAAPGERPAEVETPSAISHRPSAIPAAWVNAETALIAAIMAMTSFGLLAKARFAGAEIEGLYVPITGIAMVCWMAWWTQQRSAWLTWSVPWIFLGIAALAKGPLHLLFFYGIVLAVLWRAKRWREFFHPAHLVGVSIMCAIFAAWAVPYLQSEAARDAAGVWKDQMSNRVTDNVFSWSSYLSNLPRGVMDLLPWVLFAPAVVAMLRRSGKGDAAEPLHRPSEAAPDRLVALQQGTFWATAVLFIGLLLVPGVLPRYVLPLAVPFCLLAAMALHGRWLRGWHFANRVIAGFLYGVALLSAFAAALVLTPPSAGEDAITGFNWPQALPTIGIATLTFVAGAFVVARRAQNLSRGFVAISFGTLLGCASMLYGAVAVRYINRRDDVRPLAAEIDAAIPAGKQLVLYDPGFLSAIFYLRSSYRYAPVMEAVPENAEYVLARSSARKKFTKKRPDLIETRSFRNRKQQELFLLQPRAAVREDAPPESRNAAER